MYYHRTSQTLLLENLAPNDNIYAVDDDVLLKPHGEAGGNWSQEVVASLNEIQPPERAASRDGRERLDEEAIMHQPNLSARWTIEDSRQIEQQVLNLLQRPSLETVSVVKRPKLVIPPTILTAKGPRVVTTLKSAAVEYDSDSPVDQFNAVDREQDLEANIPESTRSEVRRGFWPRILRNCRRFFTFVIILNILAAVAIIASGVPRESLETMVALNFTIAVLVRQDIVINTVYAICCSVPKTWPLWIRHQCAKVHRFSGAHSGAAVAAAIWLLANNIGEIVCMATGKCYGGWKKQSVAAMIMSWFLIGCFAIMFVAAYSAIRKMRRGAFENIHQFVGLAMAVLFWAQVILTVNDAKPTNKSLGTAVASSAAFWLLTVSTICLASSLFWIRKVPVRAGILSKNAVQLYFDSAIPESSCSAHLSDKPFTNWRSFATIKYPETGNGRPRGHSVIVPHTQSMINHLPTHVWTRGLPVCSVMRVAALFKRVVIVCTGSGITSILDHIQFSSTPTKLIWSTPDPEETCGKRICNMIKNRVPDAVIHNTSRQGNPDLVRMSYGMAKGFDAEAVIVIANERVTKEVVYGLETRGLVAYGAPCDD